MAQCFHHAVVGPGDSLQVIAKASVEQAQVVVAVHFTAIGAHQRASHPVAPRHMARNRSQRPALVVVDHLQTATDPKHRQSVFCGMDQQRSLQPVALGGLTDVVTAAQDHRVGHQGLEVFPEVADGAGHWHRQEAKLPKQRT